MRRTTEKKSLTEKIFIILALLLLSILIVIIFKPFNVIIKYIKNGPGNGYFMPIFWVYIFVCGLYIMIIYKVKDIKSLAKVSAILFILAVIPRAIVCAFNQYIPTNDFLEYFKFGQRLFWGNTTQVADVIQNKFLYSKMCGIAVFNNIIAHVFSPTLLGFQIANIIMTSLICVTIFLIMKRYSKNTALIAALIYALYPANIFSTQITSNRHGASLMLMIAILCFLKVVDYLREKKWKKGIALSIGTSIFLTASNFLHQSIIILVLSIVIVCIVLIIEEYINNKYKITSFTKGIVGCVAVIIILNAILTAGVVEACYRAGIITSKEELSGLATIVVGLNRETGGLARKEDWGLITSTSAEERNALCIKMIKERLDNPKAVAKLMIQKLRYVWSYDDSEFKWYMEGKNNEYTKIIEQEQENQGIVEKQKRFRMIMTEIGNLDTIFIQMVYLFTIISLVVLTKNIHKLDKTMLLILLLFILGWMATMMIGAVQPRYRYQSMMAIICFAAIGIETSIIISKNLIRNIIKGDLKQEV